MRSKNQKKIQRYGVPYMGSKNTIVNQILVHILSAPVFIDLFAGGGAITHAAMLGVGGYYDKFIMNDMVPGLTQFFMDAANGKFRNEKRWISREDFARLKDSDPIVKYCWSFGNKGDTYMFSQELEPWKKALWFARVNKDYSFLREIGISGNGSRKDVVRNKGKYKKIYAEWYCREISKSDIKTFNEMERLEKSQSFEILESLCRLERLDSLERLQNLERLVCLKSDYRSVIIPSDSVVYCDIPYKGTASYDEGGFDHDTFYEWARRRDNVFISEYLMPDDFVCIATIKKAQLLNRLSKSSWAEEKLFVSPKTHERFRGEYSCYRSILEV